MERAIFTSFFDTDTKTITDDGSHNNGTFVSSGFEEYANGWFRIHLVGLTSKLRCVFLRSRMPRKMV